MLDYWTIGIIVIILVMFLVLYFALPKHKPKDDMKEFEELFKNRKLV